MSRDRFQEFITLLSQLTTETWQASVSQAPSCGWMKPYSFEWPFGPFAAFYLVLGLNNYQLKGKAEVGYWPKVVPLVPQKPPPTEANELRMRLKPFFKSERMGAAKVSRLDCFLGSELCQRMWVSNSETIARSFSRIWRELAGTMKQKEQKKTIVFAMKCLAYALIIGKETRFDFGEIPIPVDSRVYSLSTRLGVLPTGDDAERDRWKTGLRTIRTSNQQVTMIHLDSILWQIGTLPKTEIVLHLRRLGTEPRLAEEIAATVA